MKIHNFSAGPCILPQEVFDRMAQAVLNFNNSGLSLMEISHRRPDAEEVMHNTIQLTKELLNVPDTHEVIFTQGGASLQFVMVPFNMMKLNGGKAAYLDTGVWATKAIEEGKRLGLVDVVASSADKKYSYIPKNYNIPADADYFHCTSNNTVAGTQMKSFPNSPIPIVCDMSSDIMSKPVDISKFAVIYGGAQKNMGPAGNAVTIIKKEVLGKTGRDIPTYLNYQVHIDKESAFNTWSVLAIYGAMCNLEWLKGIGGIPEISKRNKAKSELMYSEIDRNGMFRGPVAVEDRSDMNATFVLNDESLKDEFDKMWKEAGIVNLKGHRIVGGYRASMYNALPIESVQVLVDVMKAFEQKFG
ncbi:MAG: 3-phosphoserine/phosphohydroxythreonine transaminase [Moheibacter sp.]